jgi:hypothetical protein
MTNNNTFGITYIDLLTGYINSENWDGITIMEEAADPTIKILSIYNPETDKEFPWEY